MMFMFLIASTIGPVASAPPPVLAQSTLADSGRFRVSQADYGYRVLSGQHNVIGVQQGIVILVEFKDVRHNNSLDQIRDVASDQLDAYYNEVSYGKVSIEAQLFGWYALPQPMSHYGNDSNSPGDDRNKDQLAIDALMQLPSSLDLTPFKYLIIVHAGQDQADDQNKILSPEIWSSCSCSVFPHYQTHEPIYVGSKAFVNYAFLSEFNGVGTFAHEWGHLFGLPDLYDYTARGNSFVGYWSLMDAGNRCCFGRTESTPSYVGGWADTLLGWVAPSVVDARVLASSFELQPLESIRATTILIPVSMLTYYFIEYRLASGRDSHLPDSGILIYFADEGLEDGILKLVDPRSGKPLPSQHNKTTLDNAVFNPGDRFGDATRHVYVGFSKNLGSVTALYSRHEFTGSFTRSNLMTPRSTVGATFGDRISIAGILLDLNGYPLADQKIEVDMFHRVMNRWMNIGSSVTDQKGHISFETGPVDQVSSYVLRLLYPGGKIGEVLYVSSETKVTLQIQPAKMIITISAPTFVLVNKYYAEVSVVDRHGEPLAGVNIAISVNNARKGFLATDASGRVRLTLHFGFGEILHFVLANATVANYHPAHVFATIINGPTILMLGVPAVALIAVVVWDTKNAIVKATSRKHGAVRRIPKYGVTV
jgi:M6 family metalloprotease-like protein